MSSLHPLPLLPYRRVTSLSLESWSGRQSLGDKSNSLSPIDLPNARDSNHGRTPANQRVDVDRALDGGREAAVEPEVEPEDVDRALTERYQADGPGADLDRDCGLVGMVAVEDK
jgi:hypothetical protein